jgi:hypothetical protein
MNRSILTAAVLTALLGACQPPAQTSAADATAVAEPASRSAPSKNTDVPSENKAAAADSAVPGAAIPGAAGDAEADVDQAIDDALGDHATYRKVIENLQKAVAAKDAAAVAALVRYPISVDIAGKKTVIEDAAAFVEDYETFMTPDIARAIIETRYADVFVNSKGVMLGRGEAWINGICRDGACERVDVKVVALQPKSAASP